MILYKPIVNLWILNRDLKAVNHDYYFIMLIQNRLRYTVRTVSHTWILVRLMQPSSLHISRVAEMVSVNQNIGSDAKMASVQRIVGISGNGLELLMLLVERLRWLFFENVLLSVRQRSIDRLEMKKDIAFMSWKCRKSATKENRNFRHFFELLPNMPT